MMPHPQNEHRNTALQCRWSTTSHGTARLEATEHASKYTDLSSFAAYSDQTARSDTVIQTAEHAADAQPTNRATAATLLKSP